MSFDDPASQNHLSERLQTFKLQQDSHSTIAEEPEEYGQDGLGEGSSSNLRPVGPAHRHEGYGFRFPSGLSTPAYPSKAVTNVVKALPDEHGLGWPGEFAVS